MILTHGANSLARGGDFVEIGGRKYPVVKIGDQFWLAENLDFAWSGLTVGGSWDNSAPNAWYYNNDESTYGTNGLKYGLLYNFNAKTYLQNNRATLIPGWHVPSGDELTSLFTAMGISGRGDGGTGTIYDNAGTKLKSTSGWNNNGNGTDDYGFNLKPSGKRDSSSFTDIGMRGELMTSDIYNNYRWTFYGVYDQNYIYLARNSYQSVACAIRLVKD